MGGDQSNPEVVRCQHHHRCSVGELCQKLSMATEVGAGIVDYGLVDGASNHRCKPAFNTASRRGAKHVQYVVSIVGGFAPALGRTARINLDVIEFAGRKRGIVMRQVIGTQDQWFGQTLCAILQHGCIAHYHDAQVGRRILRQLYTQIRADPGGLSRRENNSGGRHQRLPSVTPNDTRRKPHL